MKAEGYSSRKIFNQFHNKSIFSTVEQAQFKLLLPVCCSIVSQRRKKRGEQNLYS